MKYLLFALLAYVAWRWYVAQTSKDKPVMQPPPTPTPAAVGVEQMVSCAQCGIHLPQSEAVGGPGTLHFCGEEHRLEHARQAPR